MEVLKNTIKNLPDNLKSRAISDWNLKAYREFVSQGSLTKDQVDTVGTELTKFNIQ